MMTPLSRSEKKRRRRKNLHPPLHRRDEYQVHLAILSKLYHFGPSGKYRVMCFALTSHPITKRAVKNLMQHGLIKEVNNIEENGSKVGPRGGKGFAITDRGIEYKDKLATMLWLMGIKTTNYWSSE